MKNKGEKVVRKMKAGIPEESKKTTVKKMKTTREFEKFRKEVKLTLAEIFRKKGLVSPFSLFVIRGEMEPKFEEYGIKSRYQYRAVALALQYIMPDPEPILFQKSNGRGVFVRLYVQDGGSSCFCFTEDDNPGERLLHFQGK